MTEPITKDMLINDILDIDEDIANVLMGVGMHCVGCMAAAGESLEEACEVHELNANLVTALVNQFEEEKAAKAAQQ